MENYRENFAQATETIAAIATPPGVGGIGIVRLSGPASEAIMARLFRRQGATGPWQSHLLYYGQIVAPADGALLDTALAVLMRAPRSYTREDVAELHCHGGPAVLAQVLDAVLSCGARLAERGEFTLRAFLNGGLSLDQAEAVADLVAAKTNGLARLAAHQLAGNLSSRLLPLEQALLDLLAEITVAVDFPDDADVPDSRLLIERIANLRSELAGLLATAPAGRIYREGLTVVLAGASNVGKSSLLNRLLHSERAIVTAHPGTTRDIIEEALDLDGIPLVLSDTAGLRPEAQLDEVESIGIERSQAALAGAQIVLLVLDIEAGFDLAAQQLTAQTAGQARLFVLNKADIVSAEQEAALREQLADHAAAADILTISAQTGAGLEQLKMRLKQKALGSGAEAGREPLINNIRHQQALRDCDAALAEASAALANGLPPDLAGIDLENAWQYLGSIRGKTASDEIIANIFANFCVGK